MSLKVAIVGCGKIADGHVEEIHKIEGARVVAVCDLEILMAEQLAARLGVPAYYDDFGAMLAGEKPDVVHITTPPQSHLSLATQAIDAGCHVYVEKPFTMNVADARRLVTHAEAGHRKLTIGHTFQFDPPALDMRRLVDAGVLGEAVHVESFMGYGLEGPFGAAIMRNPAHWVHDLPGSLFQNNINHALNKVTDFLQDDEPEIKVFSYVKRAARFGDRRDEMPDELRVMIHGSDVSAYVTFSSHIKPAAHFARIYGTRSTLHVDYVSRTVTVDRGATLPSAIGRLVAGYGQTSQYFKSASRNTWRFARSRYHFFAGLNHLIRAFYTSINENTPPPIAYRDIIRITWMMDEIIRQMREGKAST